jgi:hypothetical protein
MLQRGTQLLTRFLLFVSIFKSRRFGRERIVHFEVALRALAPHTAHISTITGVG